MLSDSDSDSGVIALDNRRNGHRSGASDDVIVLSDNNQSDDEPTRIRGEKGEQIPRQVKVLHRRRVRLHQMTLPGCRQLTAQTGPKSLFVPGSAKNLLPKGPIEVKGENKLLAALWQERRNRCATTGRVPSDEAPTSATSANGVGEEQKVEIVSADRGLEMENEIMDCTVSQNSNDDVEGSTMESDNIPAHPALGREPESSSSGDSIVVVDVPPSLSRAEESTKTHKAEEKRGFNLTHSFLSYPANILSTATGNLENIIEVGDRFSNISGESCNARKASENARSTY
ncbi:hypothetical protein TELCIR_05816 [Teladorsagia circumcincta]|uniref:Uncharacterized protein n=1 Tax=Teladorsagia circumcincta TaxID=45464 RepID=A0A2G9UPU6_TELCI|nr:hypothetical protein TELCIR_05816 [Teladorsagia circumcincta]